MNVQTTDDRVAAAQQAADRHAWQESYDLLSALDRDRQLDADGLALLATIAWWAGQPDVSIAARERAFSAYQAEGDRPHAALMALLVAQDHTNRLSEAVAGGWWARAARILADEPESFAHGYLLFFESMHATRQGEFDRGVELSHRAVEIGAKYGDKDLQAYGLVSEGTALIRRGDIQDGLMLMDEATAAAVADELSPYTTGIVYCCTISVCRDLADYRRAGQWTEVAERWCERQAINGFPGVCRVHRAEILALQGQWPAAAEEALRASAELLSFKQLPNAGEGYYMIGEIRMRLGDLEAADEAFKQAHALGRDPQPGRAQLYLVQGRVDAARSAIDRALATPGAERLTRARMLPVLVEIALAGGDLPAAQKAADELATIAESFGSSALHASAHCAIGAVHIAANEPDAAIEELTRARTYWQAVDAPYDLARTRMALAAALRLRGEVDEASMELGAARAAFANLGATLDSERCERLFEELRVRLERGERARRTFVFTDIVGSTELIAAIGDDAWEDLVRWHDQTLRRYAATNGGEEVNHAGDGFFFAFRDVQSAVSCAVAIQRALADHRRESGFAPRVRIGLHADEATKVDEGYLGQGVHEAARIGALGGAGEIIASTATIEGLAVDRIGPSRSVELKGIPGLVEVQAIGWSATAG